MAQLGYDVVGGTTQAAGNPLGNRYTATEDGDITEIYLYADDLTDATQFHAAIYSDNGGVPDQLLAQSATPANLPSTAAFTPVSISYSFSNNETIWIMVMGGPGSGDSIEYYLDGGQNPLSFAGAGSFNFGDWPQAWNESGTNQNQISLYAEYTPTSAVIEETAEFELALSMVGDPVQEIPELAEFELALSMLGDPVQEIPELAEFELSLSMLGSPVQEIPELAEFELALSMLGDPVQEILETATFGLSFSMQGDPISLITEIAEFELALSMLGAPVQEIPVIADFELSFEMRNADLARLIGSLALLNANRYSISFVESRRYGVQFFQANQFSIDLVNNTEQWPEDHIEVTA